MISYTTPPKALLNIKSFRTAFILLLLFSPFFNNLYAQLASKYCDGSPTSWDNYRTTYTTISYTHDVANAATAIDDNFKQAKDVNDISNWTWWLKGANDKGDITNAGALLDGDILSFFGDRTDVSGACNIGFWFLKNEVKPVDGKFSAGHAEGDLLVLVALSVGGTLATPKVYEWKNGGLVENTTAAAYACAGANPSDNTAIGVGFDGYTNKDGNSTYQKNAFFEGAIDLKKAGLSTCFATFIVETRQSPSTTAALEDFAVGDFNATPDAPTPVNNDRCGPGKVKLTPTGCSGGTIQWYATATSTTPIHTGPDFEPDLTTTTDYYISCKIGDCESPRVKITATIKAIPTVSLKITQPTLCGTSTGSLEVCNPQTNFKYAIGSDERTYTGTAIVFSGLAAGSNPSVTVTGTNGCFSTTLCTAATATCTGSLTKAAAPEEETPAIQEIRPDEIVARIGAYKTKVLAAPNPFSDRVRFTLISDISGSGSLEIFNTMGQKLAIVYQGYVEAGKPLNREYVIERTLRANVIYVFRVGDQKTTGKLLNW